MSMIGKTFAHYQITAQIGKGGMGEVYQATDTKLGRSVAIKVLPQEFAQDTDRVARFQREAKLLASLNHPNIASIYGLEESDGTHFLVLELIEGDTLAERIKSGAIPVEEALKLALQIAEALEAAHEKGVIHRDLKPANIKVTPDGKVKVLDFGLAKAFAGEQADLNLSNSPTLSVAATQQGVILGTAAYMSPEQARGKEVDKRADIWAFGVVLFEMLTGKQVFTGDTVSDTLASVLAREPEWKSLPQNLHSRIRLLLERCLKKESKDRYSGISDARVDIQEVLANPNSVFMQPEGITESASKRKIPVLWAVSTLLLIVLSCMIAWYLKPTPALEPKQVVRLDYELPDDRQFSDTSTPNLAVSPDGSLLAYSTPEGIYLHSMDKWTAELLDRTEGAEDLFFSPDGQWIGFLSNDGKLKKIAVSGGAPAPLCNLEITNGLSWTADNRILQAAGSYLLAMPDEGGEWETLFAQERQDLWAPQMLPGGESVLFTTGLSNNKIMVRSLKRGESRELFEGAYARYIKTGHIVYGLGNDLYAVPFDPDSLKETGSHKLVVKGVLRSRYAYRYAFSESGTLAYIPGTSDALVNMHRATPVWVDLHGNVEVLSIEPDLYDLLKISPDGTQVAFTVGGGAYLSKIWIWDLVRKNLIPVTPDSFGASPLWTMDGKHIAFTSDNNGDYKIYLKAASGTGESKLLGSGYGGTFHPFPSSLSKDGKTLVFMEFGVVDGSISYDIGALSLEGDGSYHPLLKERYIEAEPKISPDGNWMAYTTNKSGQPEIYVCPYPDVEGGDRLMASTGGGYSPLWSPDMRELYYRNGNAVMAVTVTTEPALKLKAPRVLFRGNYFPASFNFMPVVMNSWDIDPDGNRFLMITLSQTADGESASETPRKINVVLNWFEELKERVPAK